MDKITLYHGSDHIIKTPDISIGKKHNDYGQGFYCTKEKEMAKEWACKQETDGFVNCYSIDMSNLKVLNLNDGEHTVLNWIALLLQNRFFTLDNELAIDARQYIIDNFSINVSDYDIVVGYRADNSYFAFAELFISNTLPLKSLNKALRLGKLGEQTALVSSKAFENISFENAEVVDKNIYYPKFIARDTKARESYRNEVKSNKSYREDIFVLDIIRQEMKNNDPRIQRIVFE